MSGQVFWLLIGLASGGLAGFWMWRRFDIRALSVTGDSAPPDEPCWTETVEGRDGLSYGRYGCYHAELKEMEARVRSGEFTTPY
jgi:hypothetical protein